MELRIKVHMSLYFEGYFFYNVIVIAKDNRHFVTVLSEHVKEHVISQSRLER